MLDLSEAAVAGKVLAGLGRALLFEKPSNRTRNSMEMAVVQLGGHPVSLRGDEVGIDTREASKTSPERSPATTRSSPRASSSTPR